eukprot:8665220-Pyramimonas_sp.AAC.1
MRLVRCENIPARPLSDWSVVRIYPPRENIPPGTEGADSIVRGIYRPSLDARKPQNPTRGEQYQRHLQGVLYIV